MNSSAERLADFTLRLIAAQSPPGQEGDVAALVRDEMERLGYRVDVDDWGNVTGTIGSSGPCVLIDAHMDTVGVTDESAWTYNPWGERVGGRLYGRGTMDMKGALAAAIHGIAGLRDRLDHGRVVVSATVVEEMIEGPATVKVAERVGADFVVIAEASSLNLAQGQRGRAEIRIETHGRPTHSSRPELGVNAAQAMVDVAEALRAVEPPSHPVLGEGILVLTDLLSRPYPANSVVPDYCVATYDRRTLPGETADGVLEPIRRIVNEALAPLGATGEAHIALDDLETYTGARIRAPNFASAWFFDRDSPIVARSLAALHRASIDAQLTHYAFCTNGSGTVRLGLPTVGFGPGDEKLAHQHNEYVELDDLAAAARGYVALAEALVG
jgi:putative selenium metabolism hydrolase